MGEEEMGEEEMEEEEMGVQGLQAHLQSFD